MRFTAKLESGRLWPMLIILVAIAIGWSTLLSGSGGGTERALRDVRDSIRHHAASGSIVIVEVDAKSLHSLNNWPWPRRHHAALVDRLHKAGAQSIGFDIDFSAHSNDADDALLAKALKNAGGSVILPTFRQPVGSGSAAFAENLPIPILRENAFLASVNIHPDNEGQVLEYINGVRTQGTIRPSLAGMIAEQSGNGSASFVIDQAIDPASIPRFSFVDVVNGKVPEAAIRGKRILIGATAIELGDRYGVPRHGVLPGVVIQAMAAETLLQGTTNPSFGGLPLLLLAMVIVGLAAFAQSLRRQIVWLAGGVTLALTVPLALEFASIGTLEASPALALLLVAAFGLAIRAIVTAFVHKSLVDQETQLPNGGALARRVLLPDQIVVAARIARFGETLSILGAKASAELVRRASERISFAAHDRTVYRVGDDALAWIADSNDQAGLDDVIAALAGLFRAPLQIGNRAVELSLSYGAVNNPTGDARTLASQALVAADSAAENGLRWMWHSISMGAEIDWKLALLSELDGALASGQIWVAYQPKADITTGQISGAEALVRWNHPERGLVPPDHFIPVIEAAGRIRELTLFVLQRALADLATWHADGDDLGIAVNISTPLLDDLHFADDVAAIIAASGVHPARLTLEITESAALANPERAVAAMERLVALGLRLSIDDYGTGQSTLSYLKRLPAAEIKIDKSFITDLVNTRNDQILVRSTIDLAHELGFKVVAEGIEDAACMALLATLGCDTAQGWHIGKPVATDVFAALLEPKLALAA